MDSSGNKLLKFVVAWAICGLCLANAAMAATPTRRAGITTRASAESYAERRSASTKSASDHWDIPRLDLRASTELPTPSVATSTPLAFPSARRTLESANYEDQLPSLGATDVSAVRAMSRAEAFARRLHREGVPMVRLWEGHTAFVSLGLNQRGKPGLWLIQKVK